MIPSQAEIRQALSGALLLAQGQPAGMGAFDLSVEGFWRSFAAPILAAPLYMLLLAEQYARRGLADSLGSVVLVESLSYGLDILCFPLLALLVTWFLGLGRRYVPLVVATNWTMLPQLALFAVALVIGLAIPPTRQPLMLTALLATFLYQWFVVRVALGTRGGLAASIVILNTLLTLLLKRALDGVL